MSGFAQARADLAQAMQKLATLDRVFAMMDEYAGLLAAVGQHPELTYDRDTGRIALEVVVGRVPPRVTLAVDEAEVAAPAAPAAPRPVEPETPAGRALKTGPWSDDEVALALKLIEDGLSNREIAARLNRTGTGIHFQLNPLRASLVEDEAEDTAAPDVAPAPAAPLKPPADFTMAEREVWHHLINVADPDWPPERDLELVQMLGGGFGPEDVAVKWGMPKADVVARWHALFPVKGVGPQARMVRALRARIAAGAA